jgi:hypothetical protein
MPVINTGTAYYVGAAPVQKLFQGAVQVWPQTPVPSITSVVAMEYHHADAAQTMVVNGTGFVAESVIVLNGVAQATVVISPTVLHATVDPANTGTADITLPVLVRNPAPGGDSNVINVIAVPEPTLASISPTSRVTTDPETTVTFTGTNFTPECRCADDGGDLGGSTYVNRTTMTAKAGWNTAGTKNFKVVDEKGHETVSKPFTITVPPVPTVTSASGLISAVAGGGITIRGTGFVAPMTVELATPTLAYSGYCMCAGIKYGCTVVSPTEATSSAYQANEIEAHYSQYISAGGDDTHVVRVATPNGTSDWCLGQPIVNT